MSLDRSTESPNSPSQDNFVPFASYRWSRSNTVRKVNSIGSSTPSHTKEDTPVKRTSVDDIDVTAKRILDHLNVEHGGGEKLRKYLVDNAYRQSLESISEYKPKTSFVSQRPSSRDCSSFESSSSDCTIDYALRTAAADSNSNKSAQHLSDSPSYLSWIESLNTTSSATEAFATDGKAGEWNNFWLNYNNVRNRYLQQNSFSCSMSTSDNVTDDFTDAKSSRSSIQKEASVEHPGDLFYLTRAEILETIRCCQKIIEVLQTVMNKTSESKSSNSARSSASYIIPQRAVCWNM